MSFRYIIAALIVCGCTESWDAYSKVATPAAELMPGYFSYSRPENVLSSFDKAQLRVVEDTRGEPRSGRPRFEFYRVEIADHEFCGQRGTLDLIFFNDRLNSTIFYPPDIASCLANIRRSHPQFATSQGTIGHTTFMTSSDYRNRPHVAWHDARLIEEQQRWVSRYA